MTTLDWVSIHGFKSIKSIECLPLGRINVLIGPNGSGKSNFIDALSLLRAISKGQLQEYIGRAGGAEKILHFGSKATHYISISVSFDGGKHDYQVDLSPTDNDSLYPDGETGHGGSQGSYFEAIMSGAGGPWPRVRENIDRWRLYHFHDTGTTSPMKRTSDIHDNRDLRAEGENLASFLYFLREKYRTSYELIRSTVRLVAPFFDDFQLAPQALNEDKIRLEWKHRGSDAYFDASAFSDGTLRFIALATLLSQPASLRPSVFLLDEPELGFHPYAITILASLIKQASVETQVILATQSPTLLDHFEPEDVLVADRVDGATTFTRLESDKLRDWLNDYSLGQLWEKNEVGGRPASESVGGGSER